MTNDPWEDGTLGQSEEHVVVVSKEESDKVDDALDITRITIGLNKEVHKQLEEKAKQKGIITQAYIRELIEKDLNKRELTEEFIDEALRHGSKFELTSKENVSWLSRSEINSAIKYTHEIK